MDNVKFVLDDGDDDRDGVKVGNLWDADDEETLRAVSARAGGQRGRGPGGPEGSPTYELYKP